MYDNKVKLLLANFLYYPVPTYFSLMLVVLEWRIIFGNCVSFLLCTKAFGFVGMFGGQGLFKREIELHVLHKCIKCNL